MPHWTELPSRKFRDVKILSPTIRNFHHFLPTFFKDNCHQIRQENPFTRSHHVSIFDFINIGDDDVGDNWYGSGDDCRQIFITWPLLGLRVVEKIVKLESFSLKKTFQLNDLPCIKKNLERTFQLKTLQHHDLSNCTFQLHTCRANKALCFWEKFSNE